MRTEKSRCYFWLILIITLAANQTAGARKPEPYLSLKFDEAAKEKKYVLLHFFADWCPSCQAQKRVLEPLMSNDDDLRKVVTLVVPYDEALSLRREYKVNRQSTFILFKDGKEISREAGLTEKNDVSAFLKKNIRPD